MIKTKKRGYFSVSCLCSVHLTTIFAYVCESSPLLYHVRGRSHCSVVLVCHTCTVTVCVHVCVHVDDSCSPGF